MTVSAKFFQRSFDWSKLRVTVVARLTARLRTWRNLRRGRLCSFSGVMKLETHSLQLPIAVVPWELEAQQTVLCKNFLKHGETIYVEPLPEAGCGLDKAGA